ncbi:MAG: hypothetical protein V1892_03280 [bacterium]
MPKIREVFKYFKKPTFHLGFLIILLGFVFLNTRITQMDDGFLYQKFAETLVKEHRLDMSIPGFHGPSLFAALIYWLTGSSYSINYFEIIAALLIIVFIYLAVREIFQSQLAGIMASYLYVLMPLHYFTAFRGFIWASFLFFVVLTLYLLYKKPQFSFLSLGLALITKPFAICLLPFFIYKRKVKQFFLALIFPILYLAIQLSQIQRVIIGAHQDLTAGGLFNPSRLIPNLFYAFQNYFSIHNYSPLQPLHFMDMIHLSPFISFLALLAIFYPRKYFHDLKLYYTLIAFAFFSLIIPASFHHLDMYYLTTFNLALIFLALLPLVEYEKLWPLIAVSFAFQFFYAYLSYKEAFWDSYIIFLIPLVIFFISIIYNFRSKILKL